MDPVSEPGRKRLELLHSRPRVGVQGAAGENFRLRHVQPLLEQNGALDVILFDIRPPERRLPLEVTIVPTDPDAQRNFIKAQHLDVLIVQTNGRLHAQHAHLAVQAGVGAVVVEKPLSLSLADAEALVALNHAIAPQQTLMVNDHYRNLYLTQALVEIAHSGQLGCSSTLRFAAKLHEIKECTAEESEQNQFLHHLVSVMTCDILKDGPLTPVHATWDRHPASDAQDTFRSAKFADKSGRVRAMVSVGKCFQSAERFLLVEGSLGWALLDRPRNHIRLQLHDGTHQVMPGPIGDTGYRALYAALAQGCLPATLLTPQQALETWHLIVHAHRMARRVNKYGPVGEFVSDWELR